MVLGGLERELANLSGQYDAAVANLGQAAIGERIEVLSKGERFSLIESADRADRARQPQPGADRRRRRRRRRRARARLHRAAGAAEPLDPPALRDRRAARRPALRHHPLHPHPRRGALEAQRDRGGAARHRGGDPAGAARRAHALPAARQPADGARGAAARTCARRTEPERPPPEPDPRRRRTSPAARRVTGKTTMERIQAAIQKAKEARGAVEPGPAARPPQPAAPRPAARGRARRGRSGLGRARGLRARSGAHGGAAGS